MAHFITMIVVVLTTVFGNVDAGEVKITASDAEASDFFGWAVDIDGDYMVVGAYQEDDGGASAGAAYIYFRDQGGSNNWGQVAKIAASDPAAGDQFGHSVGISGDYVIVGANQDDDVAINSGSAYVFNRNQGGVDNWGQVTKLTASDPALFDLFGNKVTINGDDVAIWAAGEDDGGTSAGAVYVFNRNQGGADNWGQVVKLVPADAAGFDQFGYGMSFDGDELLVGSSSHDAGGTNTGAAYLFGRDEGGTDNWGQVTKLTASDAQDGDQFGISVSISGDDIVVGAYGEDDGGNFSGAAYIFNRNQGGADNWGEVKKLTASDAEASDQFGWTVAIDGDYIVVAAPGEATNGGAGYSFWRDKDGADNWGQVDKQIASEATTGFGYNLALTADNAVFGTSGSEAAFLYETTADLSLSVSLSAFSAIAGDQEVKIEWTTASEKNNAVFLLERSADGQVFYLISEVPGQGNSSQPTDYQFIDHLVTNGQTYYYRLGDRNLNGQITWHETILVTPHALESPEPLSEVPGNFHLHQNYPNPFNPETTIRFEIPAGKEASQQIRLQVFNGSGQLVRNLVDGALASGVYEVVWYGRDDQGNEQASGVYFLNFESSFFSQTRKMFLIR